MEKIDVLHAEVKALSAMLAAIAVSLPDKQQAIARLKMEEMVQHMEASLLHLSVPDEAISETVRLLHRNMALLTPGHSGS